MGMIASTGKKTDIREALNNAPRALNIKNISRDIKKKTKDCCYLMR